jgi:hypothetical protein
MLVSATANKNTKELHLEIIHETLIFRFTAGGNHSKCASGRHRSCWCCRSRGSKPAPRKTSVREHLTCHPSLRPKQHGSTLPCPLSPCGRLWLADGSEGGGGCQEPLPTCDSSPSLPAPDVRYACAQNLDALLKVHSQCPGSRGRSSGRRTGRCRTGRSRRPDRGRRAEGPGHRPW